MLPSWIRSRNCRPRFVYFLAIEITRRRFASTISFLARRAFASPIDTSPLMSLMALIERGKPTSSCWSFFWRRSISSFRRAGGAAYFLPGLYGRANHGALGSVFGEGVEESLAG